MCGRVLEIAFADSWRTGKGTETCRDEYREWKHGEDRAPISTFSETKSVYLSETDEREPREDDPPGHVAVRLLGADRRIVGLGSSSAGRCSDGDWRYGDVDLLGDRTWCRCQQLRIPFPRASSLGMCTAEVRPGPSRSNSQGSTGSSRRTVLFHAFAGFHSVGIVTSKLMCSKQG